MSSTFPQRWRYVRNLRRQKLDDFFDWFYLFTGRWLV